MTFYVRDARNKGQKRSTVTSCRIWCRGNMPGPQGLCRIFVASPITDQPLPPPNRGTTKSRRSSTPQKSYKLNIKFNNLCSSLRKKSEHHETKEKKSTNMIYVVSHVPPWPLMPTNNGLNYISSRNCSLEFSDPSDACVSEDGGMAAWTLRLPATPTCVRSPRSEVDGQPQ